MTKSTDRPKLVSNPLATGETDPAGDGSWVQTVPAPAHLERLAAATRAFGEAQLCAELDLHTAERLAGILEGLTADLGPLPEKTPGQRYEVGGQLRNDHGSAVVGRRNPVAPPLVVHRWPTGRARAEVELGCLYEGAPGLVHGGVCTLLLDQVCAEAVAAASRAGFTAYAHTSFVAPTRLGGVVVTAEVVGTSGRKTSVRAQITDADGTICVTTEAMFVSPR
jgi:acyl-coenzyme A thioesterase PaaI-like protein